MTEAQAQPRDTPNPESSQQQPALKTPKDKNCPFCGQAFTSSSLGRHLDLYIRPKNPKPADGVHIVDEIRRIRGGITRRQVKPLKKEGSRLGTPAKRQSIDGDGDGDGDSDDDNDDSLELTVSKRRRDSRSNHGGGMRLKTPEAKRHVSRQLQKSDLDSRHKLSDEAETAKATELALRELLRSVKEANAKATGPALFDFDPYTLNFPSLCLRILPPPQTLFSPTPFPTSESWSINPPAQKQFDTLNRQVRERLLAHHQQRQINQAYPSGSHSDPPSSTNSPLPTPPLFDTEPERLFCHIADAYNHWIHQPEQARQDVWQIEILRSYARANDQRQELDNALQNARREIERLRANRWAAEISPVSFTFGSETARELGKRGMDFRNWDYDRLIEKWKTVVRDNKSGISAQKALPEIPSSRSTSMASMPGLNFVAVNDARGGGKPDQVTFSAPPKAGSRLISSDGDQADAEGDDDDDGDLEVVPASNNVTMADMHHMPLQPTPIHPAEMHAHLQSQVHAQQQMQAAHAQAHAAQVQAWAMSRQHLNHSRNSQHHSHQHPHQHQQLSPHPQHMGSDPHSRRPSGVLMDPHAMSAGGMLPMDGIESHPDQFLRIDMGLTAGFVGSNGDSV